MRQRSNRGEQPCRRQCPLMREDIPTTARKKLLRRATMTDSFRVLSEPRLEFNYRQHLVDPHDGLGLFGPYSAPLSYHPKNISYAVVGAPEGVDAFHRFSEALISPILPEEADANPRLWPPFPGFEAAFSSIWPVTPSWTRKL